MENANNLVIFVLSGAPCTGKSTWTKKMIEQAIIDKIEILVISRDKIREDFFGKKYKQNKKDEEKVTNEYYRQLSRASMLSNHIIVLDNTHLRTSYFDAYLTTFKPLIDKGKAKLYIKVFNAPYWKIWYRNIVRKLRTGKYIPVKILKDFYKRQKAINYEKYKDYLYV
jgi:predicted kinase